MYLLLILLVSLFVSVTNPGSVFIFIHYYSLQYIYFYPLLVMSVSFFYPLLIPAESLSVSVTILSVPLFLTVIIPGSNFVFIRY